MSNDAFGNLRNAVEQLVPLTEEKWSFLRSFFDYRQVPKKTILSAHGCLANELFFIHSGLARIYYTTCDNEQITAFIFSENLFAGCLESFLQQIPSLQTLETLEPTCLLAIHSQGLDRLYKELPETQVIMRKIMEQRFVASQRLLASYILSSPRERYEIFVAHHPELVQRVPQHILSSFLGITPVSLSRIRRRISEPD